MSVTAIAGEGFSSNAYVIDGGGVAVLVDPGLPEMVETILQTVSRSSPGISAIVLTHRHFDHSGAAPAIASRLGVPIFAPPIEAESLRRGDHFATGAFLFGSRPGPMDVHDLVHGGVPAGWELIHTPGHTDGSSCLLERASGLLVCGDTLFCDGGVGRWDLPTGSLEDLKRSITMLRPLGVMGLYPGHGRWVDSGGQSHVEMAIESLRGCQ